MNDTIGESETTTGDTDYCDCAPSRLDNENDVSNRWIPDTEVLDADLPPDVQSRLGRLLGNESVETLGDWIAEIRKQTGGGSVAVDDLCHSDVETPHWGEMNADRYYFLCFYDAVILSALADQPVDIRTESPAGAIIHAKAAGTPELSVTPGEAVFSFGIDETVDPPSNGKPSPEDVYAAVCPYVRAFPHPDAYKQWAESVPAATVAMPLAGATEVAAALVK